MSTRAACTIIAKNYLPAARSLAQSLRRFEPSLPVYVLVVDEFEGFFDSAQESFKTLTPSDLQVQALGRMQACYGAIELCTALKPFLLQHLISKHDQVIYLDPDIMLYSGMEEIWRGLESHPISLSPHLLNVEEAHVSPQELLVLKSGCFNLGFIGIAAAPETERFLRWWGNRLERYCMIDPAQGLFVDQKWIDLVPALFSGVGLIKHPGCNVGHWNVDHRLIEFRDGKWYAAGTELIFYHFSGYSPLKPKVFSDHRMEYRFLNSPALNQLYSEYAARLLSNGYEISVEWPYSFDYFPEIEGKISQTDRAAWRNTLGETDLHEYDALMRLFAKWLSTPVTSRLPRGARLYNSIVNFLFRLGIGGVIERTLGPRRVRAVRGLFFP